MRPYEVVIILEATADEDVVQSIIDRASGVVTAADGTVGQIEKWGRRRFAYELKKRWEGYYILIEFSLEPAAVKELDRQLGLADEVLRHKVVRIPDEIAGRARPAATEASEAEATDETPAEVSA